MEKPVYGNEKVLFFISSVISAAVWGAIAYTTQGWVLAALPFFFLIYLFAQSGFICYLKGDGALVSDTQYPDIQARVKLCAEKTGLGVTPQVYILNGNGMLNAFATSFLRRTYIVLLSDVLDGLEDKPEAINFYIGHEMGHIDRKHLFWQPWLAPALALPLLGAAYSRAREYTCDMYGALCCPPEAAQQGLSLLAVGPKRYKTLNVQEYLGQQRETSGFWMSFHELIASYPWLVKRYARVSPALGREAVPSRNFFAFILAAFVPRLNLISLVIIYFMILALVLPSKLPGMDMFMKAGEQTESGALDELLKTGGAGAAEEGIDDDGGITYKVGETYEFEGDQKFKYLGGGATDQKNWEPVIETAPAPDAKPPETPQTAPEHP